MARAPDTSAPPLPGFEPGLDLAPLRDDLRCRFGSPGDRVTLAPIAGGQSNPTYRVDVGARPLVLRKRPPGPLLPSAHAVDREFRIIAALWQAGFPVPRPLHLEEAPGLAGTAFYVMDWVEGRVFHDATLPGLPSRERREVYRSAAQTLAALHAFEPAAIGLDGFGRPQGYFTRQVARWAGQWRLSATAAVPDMERVAAWLESHLPPDVEGGRIVHGDYRIGNLMLHPSEPRVVAVLDWELATLGDPLADLAHCCAYSFRMTRDEYGGALGEDLAALGLPDEASFCADYAQARGGGAAPALFHRVFALFRNAAIFEGIAARARAGNAAAANAGEVGRLGPVLAARAAALIDAGE